MASHYDGSEVENVADCSECGLKLRWKEGYEFRVCPVPEHRPKLTSVPGPVAARYPGGVMHVIGFYGSGRQLAAECLALLRDKPTVLAEFCETLGAPVPSPNEED